MFYWLSQSWIAWNNNKVRVGSSCFNLFTYFLGFFWYFPLFAFALMTFLIASRGLVTHSQLRVIQIGSDRLVNLTLCQVIKSGNWVWHVNSVTRKHGDVRCRLLTDSSDKHGTKEGKWMKHMKKELIGMIESVENRKRFGRMHRQIRKARSRRERGEWETEWERGERQAELDEKSERKNEKRGVIGEMEREDERRNGERGAKDKFRRLEKKTK